MTVLIVYHYRLGDIVRCLPIAKYFHDRGHNVLIECAAQYHGLFEMVPYALPAPVGIDRSGIGRVLDLQIWPDRYDDYCQRNIPWGQYVCGLFDEGPQIDMQRIDLDIPPMVVEPYVRDSVVVFPTGYSQVSAPHNSVVTILAHRAACGRPVIALGKQEHGYHECKSIAELCAMIRNAHQVVTINSAPTVIAAAYRESWIHIIESPRDDFFHPRQIRVGQIDSAAKT